MKLIQNVKQVMNSEVPSDSDEDETDTEKRYLFNEKKHP